MTEGRGQRTEGRGQRADDRGQNSEWEMRNERKRGWKVEKLKAEMKRKRPRDRRQMAEWGIVELINGA